MKIFWWLFALFFFGASLLSLLLGVKNYFDEQAAFAIYEPATATLTAWVPDPKYGAGGYCPVYEFTTKEGQTRSYTGDICVVKPDPSTVGQQQEQIYYDPKNPYTSVESRGLTGSEGSGLIVGFIGFVFLSCFWIIPLVILLVFPFFRKRSAPAI